jgi:hypothetical protein
MIYWLFPVLQVIVEQIAPGHWTWKSSTHSSSCCRNGSLKTQKRPQGLLGPNGFLVSFAAHDDFEREFSI